MNATENIKQKCIKNWWEMELVMNILEFVDIKKNLSNICLVCKKWNEMSKNPLLWRTLSLNTKMINNLHETTNVNLYRWRNIYELNVYIGLDMDLRKACNILYTLQNQCKFVNNIKNLSLHVFGFEAFGGSQIVYKLLQSLRLLFQSNTDSIIELRMEYGHGLTGYLFPDDMNISFKNLKHLFFERINHKSNLQQNNIKWTAKFPNITKLSINYANLLFEDFIDISDNCRNLKYLSMFMLEHEWITRIKMIEILKLFPDLLGLQFEYPRFEPTCEFFIDFSICCPNIEVLYFWWWSIVDEHYDVIIECFRNLKYLGFAYSSISSEYIENHALTKQLDKLGLYGNLLAPTCVADKYLKNADYITAIFN